MQLIKKLEALALDLLFPQQCLGCGKEGDLLCLPCVKSINLRAFQVCPVCEQAVTAGGSVCTGCSEAIDNRPNSAPYPLDQLLVAADYDAPLLAKLIHLYKYRFITDLKNPLGRLLVEAILRHGLPMPDLIVPLPLHRRRLRWRGFNQSELLARYLAENLTPGLTVTQTTELIVRRKNTLPQMSIKGYYDRFANIKNSFGFSNRYQAAHITRLIKRKRILLVDDVCTTGATLNECAAVIRQYKPRSISAVVLARQKNTKQ